jgi:2,4-dienoyl-CoA reductase-like NADH-dependent reductase (Old Yellow Enzyme family)/thioredoxin reductase
VIFGLKILRERARRYNGQLSAQINYCGRNGWQPGSVHYAPSALPAPGEIELAAMEKRQPQEVIEMTPAKIHEMVILYAEAALRLKRAGFRIIQVHCAHNNLIGQFFSPISNFRTDQYGRRSLEDSTRFAREVLEAIRDKVGNEMVIDIRFGSENIIPGALELEEAVEISRLLEPYVDIFTISKAFHHPPSYADYRCAGNYLTEQIPLIEHTMAFREVLKDAKIVFTTNVVDLNNAEYILKEGIADFVGMFRPFLADPDIVNKYSRGRADEVNPCIRCEYHFSSGLMPITCAVNPFCGRELEYPQDIVPKVQAPKKVMVIGAGPAGLQAAWTATQRGHDVTLVEKTSELGGNLVKAAALPLKDEFKKFVNYLLPRVENCGARILLNTEGDVKLVESEKPDVLILAVGTDDFVPPIPGVDKPHVHFSWQADEGSTTVDKKVAIIGAGLVGMESALQLSRDKHEVTVIEMLPQAACLAASMMGMFVSKYNEEAGTLVLYEHCVEEILDEKVIVRNLISGETQEIAANTVLLAAGVRPRRDVVDKLRHAIAEGDIYQIGDLTDGAGTIGHAINSGFEIAVSI